MTRRIIFATVAVFVVWTALEFVLHNILLQSTYEATASLWRPEEEMKMGLMNVVQILSAFLFVLIYACLIKDKSVKQAMKFGVLYGLASGISMGYGSYAVMPIPYSLAFAWFMGSFVITLAGAAVTGLIVRTPSGEAAV